MFDTIYLYCPTCHLFGTAVWDEEPPVEAVVVVDALAQAEHVKVGRRLKR